MCLLGKPITGCVPSDQPIPGHVCGAGGGEGSLSLALIAQFLPLFLSLNSVSLYVGMLCVYMCVCVCVCVCMCGVHGCEVSGCIVCTMYMYSGGHAGLKTNPICLESSGRGGRILHLQNYLGISNPS
jgi:hypothetical protein